MSATGPVQQPGEALEFLSRLRSIEFPKDPTLNPLSDIFSALGPSIALESNIRTLFAKNRDDKSLSNPHVGLVDVHGAGTESALKIRQRQVTNDTTRARVIGEPLPGGPRNKPTTADEKHVLALPEHMRRQHGAEAFVCHETFLQHFCVFSENSFARFTADDWANVLVAGGSVLACILPVPEGLQNGRKRALRQYFHEEAYPASDIDLFIYGLDEEKAKSKMVRLAQLLANGIPRATVCVRTRHAISIISQYPYRTIQIVLRLYASPTEVLAGFDVDACSFGFDGQQVWATPRGIAAAITQTNTIDMTRRSPSYEARLAKYADRGFEIYVPDLRREDIDPSIYELGAKEVVGLARLLVLEKLAAHEERELYMNVRGMERGRPYRDIDVRKATRVCRQPGDWKEKANLRGEWMEGSTYESNVLDIPYGPKWDAPKIQKLLFRSDMFTNSKRNPKTKGQRLHRHACFLGKMEDVLGDCCQLCPLPQGEEQERMAKDIGETYVSGAVTFMVENPGRQMMSGSFQPLDSGDWCEQAYLKSADLIFGYIAKSDVKGMEGYLHSVSDSAAEILQHRDPIGRTALHLALLEGQVEAAQVLLKFGARISASYGDGRNAFHLAAAIGSAVLLKEMLRINASNQEKAKIQKESIPQVSRSKSSEPSTRDITNNDLLSQRVQADMQSEVDGDLVFVKKSEEEMEEKEGADIQSDDANQSLAPDTFELDVSTSDYSLPAIFFAVLSGSTESVEVLINAGASINQVINGIPLLTFVLLIEQDTAAALMTRFMIRNGARPTAGMTGRSLWRPRQVWNMIHLFTASGRLPLLVAFCEECREMASVLDSLAFCHTSFFDYGGATVSSSLTQALATNQLGAAAILITSGAKSHSQKNDWESLVAQPLMEKLKSDDEYGIGRSIDGDYIKAVVQPVEAALSAANRGYLLLDPNVPVTASRDVIAFLKPEKTFREQLQDLLASLKDDIQARPTAVPQIEQPDLSGPFDSPAEYLRRHLVREINIAVQEAGKEVPQPWWQRHDPNWTNNAPLWARKKVAIDYRDCFASAQAWLRKNPNASYRFESMLKAYAPNLREDKEVIERKKVVLRPDPPPSKSLEAAIVAKDGDKRLETMDFGIGHMERPSPIRDGQFEAYLDLVNAAWTGDTEKVRKYTLPVPGCETELLSASVIYGETPNEHLDSICARTAGLIELAAIARKWDCVTALFEIVAQQEEPKRTRKITYSLGDHRDSSSDVSDAALQVVGRERDEDEMEECDEETSGPKILQTNVTVETHLLRSFNGGSDSSVVHLIRRGLKDAFRAIPYTALDDYFHADEDRVNEAIDAALDADDFDFLLLIAAHGVGFAYLYPKLVVTEVSEEKTEDEEDASPDYPGLLISGIRKPSWAAKVNPEREREERRTPEGPSLLHRAITRGAAGIIDRLLRNGFQGFVELLQLAQDGVKKRLKVEDRLHAGMQAFSTIKLESKSHKERALGIDAHAHETCWQSWISSPASVEKKLEVARMLLDHLSEYARQTLKGPVEIVDEEPHGQRARAREFTSPLLVAVENGEPLGIIHFLMQQSIEVTVRDAKGGNILFACLQGCKKHGREKELDKQKEYLTDILTLVPEDRLEELAMQQQYDNGVPNQGLLHAFTDSEAHLLAPMRKAFGVEIFDALLSVRDVNGRAPVAAACQNQQAKYVQALLAHDHARKTLLWEDANGETALERVIKDIHIDSLQPSDKRFTIKPPITFATMIANDEVRPGELSEDDGKFVITLDWKTIATRQWKLEQGSRLRAWCLSPREQADQLRYVLDNVQLSDRVKHACQEILSALGDPPMEAASDEIEPKVGKDATLRRLRRMLSFAQPSGPRVPVPAVNLQRAAKARLDDRDPRYGPVQAKPEQ